MYLPPAHCAISRTHSLRSCYPSTFSVLDFPPPLQVGVVATASLFGSALLTIGVGLIGVRLDLRSLLLVAAGWMVATGVAMSAANDYLPLLAIAFVGTMNPSAASVSVFVPLEHAVLARETPDRERTAMFARYSLAGALAGGLGALAAATPEVMTR